MHVRDTIVRALSRVVGTGAVTCPGIATSRQPSDKSDGRKLTFSARFLGGIVVLRRVFRCRRCRLPALGVAS